MARVTVEDCVVRVPNRFELVMMAAQRSREVSAGAPLTVDRDNDKNPVVALREIADGTVSLEHLRDSLVKGRQRHVEMEEPEEEVIELMAGEEDWLRQTPADLGGSDDEAGRRDPFETLEDENEPAEFADDDIAFNDGEEQPDIVVESSNPFADLPDAADANEVIDNEVIDNAAEDAAETDADDMLNR